MKKSRKPKTKPKKQAGRKPKFTVKAVVAALAECQGLVYLAAKHLGCHVRTLANYRERHEEVREVISQKQGEITDTAERSLWAAIQKGEPWAVCFYLKTRGKDRGYVERAEVITEERATLVLTEEIVDAENSPPNDQAAPGAG
jgi:hypothetical protein